MKSATSACLALALVVLAAGRCFAQTYYPGNEWRRAAPEAEGVDSAALVAMLEHIRDHHLPFHNITIVRHGYLVFDSAFYPYQPQWPHDLASVTKSVTSLLTGIAIDQHLIAGTQEPLKSLLPSYREAFDSPQKTAITVRNLLTMTSGLDCSATDGEKALQAMKQSKDFVAFALSLHMVAAPGSAFAYCSPNLHLLSAVLTARTGQSEFEFARQSLFQPLGISDVSWAADAQGRTFGWGFLHLRSSDMAKLGYLYLHEGRWRNRQIVSSAWVQTSTQPQVTVKDGVGYGYNWWINTARHPHLFEAKGRGGQGIMVLRDKDAVITFLAGGANTDDIAPFLLRALHAENPMPPNPAMNRRLATLVAAAKQQPLARATLPSPPGDTRRLSGKTLVLDPNPTRLESITIQFAEGPVATATIRLAGQTYAVPLGLDGRPRLSSTGPGGLPIAGSGSWEAHGNFILELNTLANINDYRIQIHPAPDAPVLTVEEKTGQLHGYQPPAHYLRSEAK